MELGRCGGGVGRFFMRYCGDSTIQYLDVQRSGQGSDVTLVVTVRIQGRMEKRLFPLREFDLDRIQFVHTYYGLLNVRREFVLPTGRTTTVRSTTLRRRDNKDLIFSGRLKTGLLAIP